MKHKPIIALLVVICAFLIPITLSAQDTIIIDDFDNDTLSPAWLSYGNTFLTSESEKVLVIQYNRTDSSYEWDQFSVGPANLPDLSFYTINFDIRSDIGFGILLKPVYADGTSDWLEAPVSGNTGWQKLSFQISNNNPRVLSRIYFYFEGGSKTHNSGNVSIDNLVIIKRSADKSSLTWLLGKAQSLMISTVEGFADGNVIPGAKTLLLLTIDSVSEIEAQPDAEYSSIDSALNKLSNACILFESKISCPDKINNIQLVNENSSRETKLLYYNLGNIAKTSVLFGMQDPVGYGIGWTGDNDRSDIKDVCGSYPALAGWDITSIANGGDCSEDLYRYEKFYDLNGVNTVFWIPDNPFGGNCLWDYRTTDDNGVAAIIPGGVKHEWYKEQLDNIARFFHLAKGLNGESIPIIFRPFHEHNEPWFWWGNIQCSEEEYKTLYRFTVDYLVKIKKVNNMLMAYSPDRFYTEENYLSRYPGDEYADILGYDNYYDVGWEGHLDIPAHVAQTRLLVEMAEARGKIPAITECANEGIEYDDWFTAKAWGPVAADSIARRVAYIMVWRNYNIDYYWAPFPGHPVVPDFIEFYNDTATLFLDDMPELYDKVLDEETATLSPEILMQNKSVSYPNPSSGIIHFNNIEEITSIRINDMNGRCVLQSNDKEYLNTLNLNFLQNGIYTLNVHFKGNEVKNSMLILMK